VFAFEVSLALYLIRKGFLVTAVVPSAAGGEDVDVRPVAHVA
jgi:hypothetical protein